MAQTTTKFIIFFLLGPLILQRLEIGEKPYYWSEYKCSEIILVQH